LVIGGVLNLTTKGIEDLGLNLTAAGGWFAIEQEGPYTSVRSVLAVQALADAIGQALRRCYIGDQQLVERNAATGAPFEELIAARLPDPGSTMSGDFGEILVFVYLAASMHPSEPYGPLKWRLKQDRTKPAPHSDVLLFTVPSWPDASAEDALLCAEVKAKATRGASNPIAEAIRDSTKDRTSRLSKTLEWLRERALHEDIPGVDLDILNRFSHASEHPRATTTFLAAAVIAADLEAGELPSVPDPIPPEISLVLLVVPELQTTYDAAFVVAGHRIA
jgi:HamA